MELQIIYKKTAELLPYARNARTHSDSQVKQLAASIKEFGFNNPVAVDAEGMILCGHGRVMAAQLLGMTEVPTVCLSHLSPTQVKAYILADNKLALNAGWDNDMLKVELQELKDEDFDIALTGFSDEELNDILVEDPVDPVDPEEDDFAAEPPEVAKCERGDVWTLGDHRLMCGDSTSENDVGCLMLDDKADMVFTDPPYGMKKEKEGVLNDNLNFSDLLEFNKKWIPLSFKYTKENGSWYCWGIDEPLMDIYSEILKPMIKEQKATFRNLITWDKGTGQGQLSADFRCYAPADEKCLFVMCGVQGFNTNADNYYGKWEPIRAYFETEIKSLKLSDQKIAEGLGFKDGRSVNHWYNKSQFEFINKENFEKLRAFGRKHAADFLKREYDEIKREYDEIKREYYASRAYFDNTHDNMNNVWHFERTSLEERKDTGNHATPKPIALCCRAIKTSSCDNEKVLDLFGGSGSTLIACEQLNRKCYMMELDEHYCDVIITRWQKLTGKDAIRQDGVKFNDL